MEDAHGQVWSEAIVLIIIAPANGRTNGSGQSKPLNPSTHTREEKLEVMGGVHSARGVRLQSSQALHDIKESVHDRLRLRPTHGTRHPPTTSS